MPYKDKEKQREYQRLWAREYSKSPENHARILENKRRFRKTDKGILGVLRWNGSRLNSGIFKGWNAIKARERSGQYFESVILLDEIRKTIKQERKKKV